MKPIIRSILQNHLVELSKFNTAWEGVNNKVELPYQSVFLTIATSQTSTIAERPLATETGFFKSRCFTP